jgi:hypothetical protein
MNLLHDILPIDEPLQAVTIRNHVLTLTECLGERLGTSSVFYRRLSAGLVHVAGHNCPLTVGIDGGYMKAQGEQGWFEVIAGRSRLAVRRGEESQEPVSSQCFAFMQTYD